MKINTNLSALKTYNNINRAGSKQELAVNRLASGFKINSVSDDAAGMSISIKMKAQIRGLGGAAKNNLDGISLVQTADGVLGEVHAALQRMRELALRATNGTIADLDRDKIQMEIDQLKSEIDSTAARTNFNKINLLDGSAGMLASCKDVTSGKLVFATESMGLGQYGFDLISTAGNIYFDSTLAGAGPARIAVNLTSNINQVGTITINGVDVVIAATDTGQQVFNKLDAVLDAAGYTLTRTSDWGNGTTAGKLIIESKSTNTRQVLEITSDNNNLLYGIGLSKLDLNASSAQVKDIVYFSERGLEPDFTKNAVITVEGNRVRIKGTGDQEVLIDIYENTSYPRFQDTAAQSINLTTTPLVNNDKIYINGRLVLEVKAGVSIEDQVKMINNPDVNISVTTIGSNKFLNIESKKLGESYTYKKNGDAEVKVEGTDGFAFRILDGGLKLQIGPDQNMEIKIVIPNVNCYTLEIDKRGVWNVEEAYLSVDAYYEAIQRISKVRAKLGAYQNRLEYTESNLSTAQLSTESALARIIDTDMAIETTEMTKQNVIFQAGIAVMAQANLRPQQILRLLE